jgi:hypothetical protein
LKARPNPDSDHPHNDRAPFVFAVTILLVIGAYATLSIGSGSPSARSSSPSDLYGGVFSGTNSSGANICCHFVGSDPAPQGCQTPLGTPTLNEDYSLQIYASSRTVNANGDALCITPLLRNLNGTLLTFGTRSGRVSFSFNVTNPSGKVVFRNDCPYYTSPPSYMSSYNESETTFGCTAVWYTTASAPGGGLPSTTFSLQPGAYVISCSASFPGFAGLDVKVSARANATITVFSP